MNVFSHKSWLGLKVSSKLPINCQVTTFWRTQIQNPLSSLAHKCIESNV